MRWSRQTIATVVVVLVAIAGVLLVQETSDDGGGGGAGVASSTGSSVDPSPGSAPDVVASGDLDPYSGLPWILEGDLPVETRETLALIDEGGPYPYPDKDGSTFQNREGVLPDEPSGYYAEYTVLTPGESDRGPRRIVAGDGGELYWTADHYESFERIARVAS